MRRVASWSVALGLKLALLMLLMHHGIPTTHMHPDEELSYRFTYYSLNDVATMQHDNHSPSWWVFFWFWWRLAGDSEFAGRYQSILYTALTLCLVFILARSWFRSTWVGHASMILLGLSAMYWNYTLDIRPYPLLLLAAVFSMFTLGRWVQTNRYRWAMIYGVSTAFLLYTHYYAVLLILCQGLFILGWAGLNRQRWKTVFVGAGVGLLLWSPWMPTLIRHLEHIRSSTGTSQVMQAPAPPLPTTPETVMALMAEMVNGWIGPALVLLVVGTFVLWQQRWWWLALLWMLFPPAFLLLVNLSVPLYVPRYIVFSVPGLAIGLGAALGQLPSVRRVPIRSLILCLTIVGTVLTLDAYRLRREPYRDVLRAVSATARPDDILFFDGIGIEPFRSQRATDALPVGFVERNLYYYLDADFHERVTNDLPAPGEYRRIWHITLDWFNPMVRNNFAAIESTHPLQAAYGDCNPDWCLLAQLLETAPWREPVLFGDNIAFYGADIDDVSAEVVQMRLWWRVRATPDFDYVIGLQLLDAEGRLIAQQDGPITDFYTGNQISLSAMMPDVFYIDTRTLSLPIYSSPVSYMPLIVVYDWRDGRRLTTSAGDDGVRLSPLLPAD